MLEQKATGNHCYYFPMKVMEMSKNNFKKASDPRGIRRHDLSGDRGAKCATGQDDVGNQASPGKYATGRRTIQLRNKIRVGTWNVRGLLKDGKLKILESELERCNSTITGISETHWKDSGHFDTGKHTIYYSGKENNSFGGVAIAIPKLWNNSVLGYNPVNERIMSIKIDASPVPINIVQVYAPTSTADDDIMETFYNELETCMDQVPKREPLIVLGDFNAKVGSTKNESGLRHIVGLYGLGTRNDRGERLIQFAADNNLTIMNTVFKQHPRRLYTWTSPDGKHRNQIDYVMIRTRWRSSICNAHTLPGADCLSDHELLICGLKLKLRNCTTKKISRRIEIVDREAFYETLQNVKGTSTNAIHDGESESLWQSAKTIIKDAVKISQPRLGVAKRQHWMSWSTWKLVEKRRKEKASGASMEKLNLLSSEIQTACRRDRNMELNTICTELERHAQKLETRDLHIKIRTITKQFKPKSWAIENSAGNAVTEIKLIVRVWEEYCKSLFLDKQRLLIPESKYAMPTEQEPSILRVEVEAAIKHLKCGKATGVDEIPIEIFKMMGDIGVDTLHSICLQIWNTGEWPKDWSHST